jgi:Phosphoinositide 3-kinase family, accessory domain (PIK domain)
MRHTVATGTSSPEGVALLLRTYGKQRNDDHLRHVMYWASVSPIAAISMLGSPQKQQQPWIIQYAVRVLEHFPVEQVFFYIPQMVQALRSDGAGKHFLLISALIMLHPV